MRKEDIVLDVKAKADVKAAMKELQSLATTVSNQLKSSFVVPPNFDLGKRILGGQKGLEDFSKQFKADIDSIKETAKGVSDQIIKGTDGMWSGFVKVGKGIDVMGNQAELKKFSDSFAKSHKTTKKFSDVIKKSIGYFRTFRMEMLGILFAGQGLSRLFWGLLAPSLELVGIFDIWNTLLQVFFLPIALELLDKFILPLFDWISKLSPETQMFIGVLALLGLGLGSLLSTIGSVVLGINAMVLAWNALIGKEAIGSALAGSIGNVATQSGIAKTGLEKFWSFAKTLIGWALIFKVGLDILGRGNRPLTASEWISDLGFATMGGFLVGGIPGALAAFAIALVVDITKESLEATQAKLNRLSQGGMFNITPEGGITGHPYGTVVPEYVQREKDMSKYGLGSGQNYGFGNNNPIRVIVTGDTDLKIKSMGVNPQ